MPMIIARSLLFHVVVAFNSNKQHRVECINVYECYECDSRVADFYKHLR